MISGHPITSKSDIETQVRLQAKIRAKLGFPVILLMSLALWYWGSPYPTIGMIEIGAVACIYTVYNFAALYFANWKHLFTAEQIVLGTAVLDPLMLSVWLAMMGESGGLFVCFYLFTILGFGFRIGTRPMRICQTASIIGFSMVIAVSPVWKQHPIFAFSFLMLLLIIPLYATGLIKKLRDARAHAESESQAKSQLLAKVSHELRTPLTGIVASAQLIEAGAHDEVTLKRADTILRLSKNLLLEINDLLDSAKYNANSLVLECSLFDLRDVMDQLQAIFASTAAAKGIRFTISMDKAIKEMVQGDSHYLSRVLMNIAGNAVKFTETGKVDLGLKLLEEDADSYLIRFSVQDTGIGIPKELHQNVFEPFFQASGGTTRKYGGTGLGLSIANEIVTLMGGNLMLDSEPGRGSLFYFDLKLPKVVKTVQQIPVTMAAPIVYGKRILVADDNATNLILFKELLERDRHQVTVASTGKEALDILNLLNVDLIFLDYNMGDIDGATVLQIYRFGKLNAAPAFFITADATLGTATKLRDSGAAGVLHKPVTGDRLREAIAQIFGADPIVVPPGPSPTTLKPVPLQYIDPAVIEELGSLCQRPEFLIEVLETAAQDIEKNCEKLVTALEDENISQIHDSAHALLGLSQSIGAMRIAALTAKLMKITHWEVKPSKERWKNDIREAEIKSVESIHNMLANYSTSKIQT
jgi:two-component system sensor histidine kinase RpfC